MTCARIVTGARGLVGATLADHLAQLPGTLLAIDTRPARHQVIGADAAGEEFPALLATHLRSASRAELYHTAGHIPELARITDILPQDFARTVADNLTTTYSALRTFALTTRQLNVPAAAVVLSSVGASRAHRYLVGYDAAKAGIESLVRSFTVEFGAELAVRALALGPLAQSASTAADGDRLPALLALVPRGTYADLYDVAHAIAAFGGPEFDATAGHTLTLDGGLSIQLRPAGIERPPADARTPRPAREEVDTGHHPSRNQHPGGPR
ncbi:MAG: SDR family oxidoreductase [Pseudonocardiaceae bacterium]